MLRSRIYPRLPVLLATICASTLISLRHDALLSPLPPATSMSVPSSFLDETLVGVSDNPSTYAFCAMTRVRNMPRTVAEWIEYHAALGVGHFFILDDCSTDDGKTRAVLDVYRQEGLVSLYDAEDLTQDECGHLLETSPAEEQAKQQENGRVLDTESERMSPTDPAFEQCRYACRATHTPDERRLFRFLFRQLKNHDGGHHCDWTMVFDPDEYLTIQRDLHPSGDLTSVLAAYGRETHNFPVLHVPWVFMGSEGLEKRPPGLLIDNFHVGHYPAWMLKTAARAAYVESWDFSHWPIIQDIAASEAVSVHGFAIPEPFESLRKYTERNWLFDNESRVLHPDPTDPGLECQYPASPLFLKHYAYRSFEEFVAYRANPANLRVKSDGGNNREPLERPRDTWENGWGVHDPRTFEGPCARFYANEFTASMADKTRVALAARRERWNQDREREDEGEGEWRAWHGRRGYDGRFPLTEEWLL